MKPFYSILLILVLSGGALRGGQSGSLPEKSALKQANGEDRVRRWLDTAEKQIFRSQIYHTHPSDTALLYIRRAIQLADTLGLPRLHNECLCIMARYYFAKNEVRYGQIFIMQAITECQRTGDRSGEAGYWQILGHYLPKQDSTYSIRKRAFRMAFDLYQRANKNDKALLAYADWEQMEGSYHRKMDADMLISAAALHLYMNEDVDFARCIHQLNETVKLTDTVRRFGVHYLLCEEWVRHGLEESTLQDARICLDLAEQNRYPELFYVARLVVKGLIKKDSAQEALRLMQRITRDHSPRSALEDRVVSYCYGMIYERLGRVDTAERYFLRVMRLDPGFLHQPKESIFLSLFFQPAETAIGIGALYIRRGKFRAARSYLQQVFNDPLLAGPLSDRREMALLLFRASQALRDYRVATKYHEKYEVFNDSVIKKQQMSLYGGGMLLVQAQSKADRVSGLYFSDLEGKVNLKRARFERNIILACSAILLLASAFLLWGYRMKKRNLFQLRQQQLVIHQQNQVQQQLIGEKDKLLAEKDLLMREIHHRVKNNLNIIISLLESQSLYLNNEAARVALQDTQNRVHAVFLLHEKLYGSTTVPELNVHAYVLELINHLYESFDFRNENIVITHTIESIYLGSPEVLPLAVILNEAVTNSLKYAFPDGRKGEIHLTLRQTPAGMVQMQIRDNGVGLPAGYSPAFGKTLGFTLITGLANQLEGYCGIENDGGVVITIRFRPKERRAFAGLVSSSA